MTTNSGAPSSPVRLIVPLRYEDDRGWFSETFSVRAFAAAGLSARFVQDNQSLSRPAFTLRGIHFQAPPHAQAKLVRCVSGRTLDVAVDLRAGSPTFGRWVGTELSAANGRQLFVPTGFGHGFLTLEPDSAIAYKCSDYYAPECEGGLRWDDPDLAIGWGFPPGASPILSAKDAALPLLRDFASPFGYDGDPLLPLGDGHWGNP
jgi:dTDP-4-dehydrorhamnose 3,5-epimerase